MLTTLALNSMAAWGRLRFGSLKAALLYTGGMRVVADPNSRSVGDLKTGEQVSVKFRVANFSGGAVTIHGSTASCSCLVVDELPKTIPAGGREEIEIGYKAGRLPGEIRQSATLLTDAPTSPRILLTITGRVVAESARLGGRTDDTR